jgi:hypothetical protein
VSSPREEVHEPIVHRVVKAEAGGVRADPEAPLRVHMQSQDIIGGKTVRIRRSIAIDSAGVAVESHKSAYGAYPDETLAITNHV